MNKKLMDYELKLSAYSLAISTMNFDIETIATEKGSNYRNQRLGFLSGERYSLLTSDEFYNFLMELKKENLDKVTARKVDLYLKEIKDSKVLSKEEVIEYNILVADSIDNWKKAREENNYKIFEPYLKKLIQFAKNIAEKRAEGKKPYNVLLNDYEEGMSIEKYDEFFNLLKERLVPLIKKISDKQDLIDDSLLKKNYDIDRQKQFVNYVLEYLGFDKSWGYLGISTHPFCSGISQNDVRITTRYIENEVLNSIYSVIHETGHATYEHQIRDEFDGTIIQSAISMGMHESQSRLFENYLTKSKSFWKYNFNKFKEIFSEFKDVELNDFYNQVNTSKLSLIRTEADELTYPLHILVRYEIEKGIFDNSIDIDNLDVVFKEMMSKYLLVTPNNDLEGILQDIHWSGGSFGYFPTYALGSAYSAQIYNAMNKDIDVDYLLENGEFFKINEWLKENIHQYAGLYSPEEILIKATGEKFNPKYYIDYLENKFKKVYQID